MKAENNNLQINNHLKQVIYNSNEDSNEDSNFCLEEIMIKYSNEVLGIKVRSVFLPENYNKNLKTEKDVIEWLKNRHKK